MEPETHCDHENYGNLIQLQLGPGAIVQQVPVIFLIKLDRSLVSATRGNLMKVWKRPRSPYYSYLFQYKGDVYCRSTGSKNRREAEDIAAAARARVIRQAAGLEKPELSGSRRVFC